MDKIVVFGGTFNPIHYGHMRCAIEVSEALAIPRVVFMPAATSPHKSGGSEIGAEIRLHMARLGTGDNPLFDVSDMEVRRGAVSYTVDTVGELIAAGVEPTLIVGADQYNLLSTWVDYEQILRLADIAVVPRPGITLKTLEEALSVEVAAGFCYDKRSASFVNKAGHCISFVDSTLMGISSSDIRRRVMEGRSISHLVSPAVESYIKEQGLYLTPEGA